MPTVPEIPEKLRGIPRPIRDYYLKHGTPAEIVSSRYANVNKNVGGKVVNVSYWSFQFKGISFRHKWNDAGLVNRNSKIKQENWTMEELPL